MSTKIEKQLKFQKAFIIDAFGAMLSSIMLIWVLPNFQNLIGLPISSLYFLGAWAILFVLFSGSGIFIKPKKPEIYLKIVAGMNSFYSLLSLALVLYYFEQIQFFGLLYFIVELLVLVLLISWEFRLASAKN